MVIGWVFWWLVIVSGVSVLFGMWIVDFIVWWIVFCVWFGVTLGDVDVGEYELLVVKNDVIDGVV